jgi:aspartokinase/homoserine dehydrogenase 1
MKTLLRVMKFGGTSVGDASCIERVVEIIGAAARNGRVLVVVSAMGGVTNRLIEAANQAEAGNEGAVAGIFALLRKQHDTAVTALIDSVADRGRLQQKLHALLAEGERLCQGALFLRKLTPGTLDAISALGERLSAPLVAGALAENGIESEAIDATELVVTNACHGGAEPCLDHTRTRCQSRLFPLLKRAVVPVVTGFIGATGDGVLTTLGRGGSDYSATILGAVLDADEVVIWTDVSGLLTADPKLVPEASPIAEISYREAAELAHFGAKVLHPKTLRPVMQGDIPIWIRNTFAPTEPGTKITPLGQQNLRGVTAITAIQDVALIATAESTEYDTAVCLITVVGENIQAESGMVARAFALLKESKDIDAVAHGSSDCSRSFLVPQRNMELAIAILHRELELGSPPQKRSVKPAASPSALWKFESEQASAD